MLFSLVLLLLHACTLNSIQSFSFLPFFSSQFLFSRLSSSLGQFSILFFLEDKKGLSLGRFDRCILCTYFACLFPSFYSILLHNSCIQLIIRVIAYFIKNAWYFTIFDLFCRHYGAWNVELGCMDAWMLGAQSFGT